MTIQNYERIKERIDRIEKMVMDLYDKIDQVGDKSKTHQVEGHKW